MIKAISCKQPATTALLKHGKTVENRPRKMVDPYKWRMPFWCLLHASKAKLKPNALVCHDPDIQRLLQSPEARRAMPVGAIVGAIEITNIVSACERPHDMWVFGPWCLEIGERISFSTPIPYKGALGLYNVPVVDIESQLGQQLETRIGSDWVSVFRLEKREKYPMCSPSLTSLHIPESMAIIPTSGYRKGDESGELIMTRANPDINAVEVVDAVVKM